MSDSVREAAIKARLRALVACAEPEVTWAAEGLGARCAGCLEPIHPPQVEVDGWMPDGRLLVLHEACYRLWLEVCEKE